MTSAEIGIPSATPVGAHRGRLIVQGQDGPGIVAAISSVLRDFGANIVALDQYSTDPTSGRFFQRTEFELAHLTAVKPELEAALHTALDAGFDLTWRITESREKKRVAIFASKADHCLLDLLWRQRNGEIDMTVAMVISNHPDLAEDVRGFGVPYFHVPVDPADKPAAERRHLDLLRGNVDLVVLARYMQILSGSFLPAFVGADPYTKAKARGVKLIGATSHYVTEDLDEGPIIEQDVVRVSHRESARDLTRRGADVERQVLSRAVAWHCDDRVLRDGNTTVVF